MACMLTITPWCCFACGIIGCCLNQHQSSHVPHWGESFMILVCILWRLHDEGIILVTLEHVLIHWMPFHVLQIFAVPVFMQLEKKLRVPRAARWKIFSVRALYVGKELEPMWSRIFWHNFSIFFFSSSYFVVVWSQFLPCLQPCFSHSFLPYLVSSVGSFSAQQHILWVISSS